MSEINLDTNLIERAAAAAIVTFLGDDKDKLVAGLVKDVLSTPTTNYNKETQFQAILKSVIHEHTRSVIREWVSEHRDEINAHIKSLIDENKDQVIASVSEDIFKKIGWF